MVVNYTVTGGSFAVDKPRIWSGEQLANTGTAWNYDVASDGEHLVGLVPTASSGPQPTQSHIMITTNILEKVRERIAGQGK